MFCVENVLLQEPALNVFFVNKIGRQTTHNVLYSSKCTYFKSTGDNAGLRAVILIHIMRM